MFDLWINIWTARDTQQHKYTWRRNRTTPNTLHSKYFSRCTQRSLHISDRSGSGQIHIANSIVQSLRLYCWLFLKILQFLGEVLCFFLKSNLTSNKNFNQTERTDPDLRNRNAVNLNRIWTVDCERRRCLVQFVRTETTSKLPTRYKRTKPLEN